MTTRMVSVVLVGIAFFMSACKSESGRPETMTAERFIAKYSRTVAAAADTSIRLDSAGLARIVLDSVKFRLALDSTITSLQNKPKAWPGIIAEIIERLELEKSTRDSLLMQK